MPIVIRIEGKYLDHRGQERNLTTGLCPVHSRLLLPDVRPKPMAAGKEEIFVDSREAELESKEREVGDLVSRE